MGIPSRLGVYALPRRTGYWKQSGVSTHVGGGQVCSKNELLRAKRFSNRKKPKAKVPNQFWGIDMTKIRIQGWGWVYFYLVIDWYTKEIIGKNVTLTSKTQDWLEDLHLAVQSRFPNGIRLKRVKPKLISDNGCQPTSISFMESSSTLGIKQICNYLAPAIPRTEKVPPE